ncbi:DUF1441 family protein [Salmonella enterica]|nr:DUF1441 family protein [Salmonella enterica]
MDQEIKSLELNITQLSAITGAHRQTIASRLKGVKTSGGNGSNLKIYRLVDILTAMMMMPAVTGENDPNKMKPSDRRAWFQSEMTRIELEKEMRTLIPASEVLSVYAVMAKTVVKTLEILPDLLERDAALPPDALEMTQKIIDQLREDLASMTYQACADAINGDDDDNGDEGQEEEQE